LRDLLAAFALFAFVAAEPTAQPPATPPAETRCAQAASAIAAYDAVANDAGTSSDDAATAALSVSAAYDKCAAFASARGEVADLQYLQVRSAHYHYVAANLYFSADDYPRVHEQLEIALALIENAIADRRSQSHAAALGVRSEVNALYAKIPVPTGISTAPATYPARSAPR